MRKELCKWAEIPYLEHMVIESALQHHLTAKVITATLKWKGDRQPPTNGRLTGTQKTQ